MRRAWLCAGTGVVLVLFGRSMWQSVDQWNRDHAAGSDAVRFGFAAAEQPASHLAAGCVIALGVGLLVMSLVLAKRLSSEGR